MPRTGTSTWHFHPVAPIAGWNGVRWHPASGLRPRPPRRVISTLEKPAFGLQSEAEAGHRLSSGQYPAAWATRAPSILMGSRRSWSRILCAFVDHTTFVFTACREPGGASRSWLRHPARTVGISALRTSEGMIACRASILVDCSFTRGIVGPIERGYRHCHLGGLPHDFGTRHISDVRLAAPGRAV